MFLYTVKTLKVGTPIDYHNCPKNETVVMKNLERLSAIVGLVNTLTVLLIHILVLMLDTGPDF